MTDRFMLTPFFLDKPVTGLAPLAQSGWQVNEPVLTEGQTQQRMIDLHRPLANFTADTIRQGQRPVSVAGDCCTTIGFMAGLQQAELAPTLIWFDAHGDFNTWETTPSGFLGGMPLAMLVGRGEQRMPEGVGLQSLAENQVILTDGRDLDPGERTAVEASNITHLPDISQLLTFPLPDGPLYVHFDTDIVDPAEIPALNYPAPGGPSVTKVRRVFRHLAQTGRVRAVSISSWNPDLDHDGRSREKSMSLLADLLSS